MSFVITTTNTAHHRGVPTAICTAETSGLALLQGQTRALTPMATSHKATFVQLLPRQTLQ